MIPSIADILLRLVSGELTVDQATDEVEVHLAQAESKITVNVPALDRIAGLLERAEQREQEDRRG